MRRQMFALLAVCLAPAVCMAANEERVTIKVLETSDIHGSFLPYDFINQRPAPGSLARAYTYIKDARAEYGENVILADNGDILQGQPIVYYSNYIATDAENITATITNFAGYDVQGFGNHDIETGHAVYDKWVAETHAPVICANLTDTLTGAPYTSPYCVIERQGVRIAFIGILTNAVPCWIGEDKYGGLRFDDAVETARTWVAYVRENEHPDFIIGLFHTGLRGGIQTDEYEENSTEHIARAVDGFDAILFGHDHTVCCDTLVNDFGRTVWLLNPANAVHNIAELTIDITRDGGQITGSRFAGRIVDVTDMPVDEEYAARFAETEQQVREFTNKEVGTLDRTLYTRDAFFGSNPYIDFINAVQLDATGADISFCSPLEANAVISTGMLRGADMFNMYKYENLLSVITLSGQEIKDYLEMSYALWTNTMTAPEDRIMRVEERQTDSGTSFVWMEPTFNFDAAAGIDYEVDVTKPAGEKVNILGMSGGEPFSLDAVYKVALNSYRATGGGELLTKGAGIKKADLKNRIVWQSTTDLRNYIMQYIEARKAISPRAANNWRFVPDEWATPALVRDKQLIFGE
ncbi:MAG: bifunctional metallophosphatase/5'-nucleotidase [Prevotella sp.]|nr:bifunctional metallophosphatase/5'-nucleotidase [Prevotella sp.]